VDAEGVHLVVEWVVGGAEPRQEKIPVAPAAGVTLVMVMSAAAVVGECYFEAGGQAHRSNYRDPH